MFEEGKSGREIKGCLDAVTLSIIGLTRLTLVVCWVLGALKTAIARNNVTKVYVLVLADHQLDS